MKPEETVDYHIKTTWHAISRMYNQMASSYDATMSVGFVLLNIRKDQGTPATKIGPQMGLEARSLTRILKRLEEEKLISRKRDPRDGRSVRIFLTEEGEEKRKISANAVKSFNNKVNKLVSPQHFQTFLEVMSCINSVVDETINKSNGDK